MKQYTQLIVKKPFQIKGKRGRPLLAKEGDCFVTLSPEYWIKEHGQVSVKRENGASDYLVGIEVITEYFRIVPEVKAEYTKEQLKQQLEVVQSQIQNAENRALFLQSGQVPPQFVGSELWNDEMKTAWINKAVSEMEYYSKRAELLIAEIGE